MFNLQANAMEIANAIKQDLTEQTAGSGMEITGFQVMSFNYPKEVQDMINKNASQSMVGDLGRYQQVTLTEGMASGSMNGGGVASDMMGMMMGMNVAGQMMKNMGDTMQQAGGLAGGQNPQQTQASSPAEQPGMAAAGSKPNFCPNCGQKTGEGNFCPNCGQKLV